MFFRNLVLFRFAPALDLSGLENQLADCQLKPVGPLEFASRGFVSPFGRSETHLTHRVGKGIWLTLGGEDKILPGAVINDALAKKIADIETKEDRKLGGRARKRLKEDLVHDMLPKAFVRPSRTNASIDTHHGVVFVDTTSRKVAEGLVSEIRRALGSFPALPLNAETSPRAVLTGWLAGEPLPEGLAIGDECELRDPVDGGACWKGSRAELAGDEIRHHLEAGKQVTRLALTLDDHLSFVLGEDLVVRKLKFLDGAMESMESIEHDSVYAELDARYALLAGELSGLFTVLEHVFQLSRSEAGDSSRPLPTQRVVEVAA